MSETVSISTAIARRYASAVFDLAKESGSLEALEVDVAVIEAALGDSRELRALISSPLVTRKQQSIAITALAEKMKLSEIMQNALGLKAEKRRLFVLPQFIAALRDLLAEERDEVTAEIVSAKALSEEQSAKLAETLKASVGKNVTINATVDESLIGGLVVKVGSKMIDTSIRSKLDSLQNAMKEVG